MLRGTPPPPAPSPSPAAFAFSDAPSEFDLDHLLVLAACCVLGFLGRAVGQKILACFSDICCKGYLRLSDKEFLDALVVGSKDGASGVTLAAIEGQSLSWDEAAARLKLNACAAKSVGALRLVFFHWSQPVGYGVALWSYKDQLTPLQLYLGYVVAGREAVYLLLTLACVCINPAFLLVDSAATFKNSGWNLLLYVVAPEKFVYFCLGFRSLLPLALLVLCDLSAIAALGAAVSSGVVPVPLMIGYSITALGGLAAVGLIAGPLCCAPSAHTQMMMLINGTSRRAELDLSSPAAVASTSADDLSGLLGALKRDRTLRRLNLCNRTLNNEQATLLADALRCNPNTLEELELDWALVGTEVLGLLFATNHRCLPTQLSLRRSGLNVADAFRLCKLLRTNTTVESLDLSGNDGLGDEGATAFAKELEHWDEHEQRRTLTGIDLSACAIGDRGAVALSASLAKSRQLSWVFLYGNTFGARSMRRLLGIAKERPALAVGVHAHSGGGGGGGGGGRFSSSEATRRRASTMGSAKSRSSSEGGAAALVGVVAGGGKTQYGTSSSRCSSDGGRGSGSSGRRGGGGGGGGGGGSPDDAALRLRWEIQLQQLMACARCSAKELKLMLARNFVYTKMSFVGASKYRRLKAAAGRLLKNFQRLYGSRSRGRTLNKTSSSQMLALCASEEQDRAAFRALLDAMVRGDDLSVGGGGGGDGVGRPPDQDGGGGGAAGAGLKTIMSSKSMLGD